MAWVPDLSLPMAARGERGLEPRLLAWQTKDFLRAGRHVPRGGDEGARFFGELFLHQSFVDVDILCSCCIVQVQVERLVPSSKTK